MIKSMEDGSSVLSRTMVQHVVRHVKQSMSVKLIMTPEASYSLAMLVQSGRTSVPLHLTGSTRPCAAHQVPHVHPWYDDTFMWPAGQALHVLTSCPHRQAVDRNKRNDMGQPIGKLLF